MSEERRPQDPFGTLREVLDHRYDEGYWTGGRVHPIYRRSSRPNRYGYVLIFFGLLAVAGVGSALRQPDWSSLGSVLFLLLGIVMITGGVRLLRPARKAESQH